MVGRKQPERAHTTTISVDSATKGRLESIKLAGGDETWDHELTRLYRIAKAAEQRGILEELQASRPGLPALPPRPGTANA